MKASSIKSRQGSIKILSKMIDQPTIQKLFVLSLSHQQILTNIDFFFILCVCVGGGGWWGGDGGGEGKGT